MKVETINKEAFRPKTITLSIIIETKEELDNLKEEFKNAGLEYHDISNNEGYKLISITRILEELEKGIK